MQQLTIHLNHQTKRWEWRDGQQVMVAFSHVGQCYVTTAGQPLGVRWDDAKAAALKMAEARQNRMIMEKS